MDLNKALNQVMNAGQGGGGNLWYPKDVGTTVVRPLPVDPMIVNRMVHWGIAEKGPIRCTKDNPATFFAAGARALAEMAKEAGNKKAAYELDGFAKGHRALSSVGPQQEFFMNIAKGGGHNVWKFNYAVQKALVEAIQELEALEVGAGRPKPNPFDPEAGHNLSVTKKEKGWSLKFDQIPSAIQLSGWQEAAVDLSKYEDAPEMTHEEIRESLEDNMGPRLAKLGLDITTVTELIEFGKEAQANARAKYAAGSSSKREDGGPQAEDAEDNEGVSSPEPKALFRD